MLFPCPHVLSQQKICIKRKSLAVKSTGNNDFPIQLLLLCGVSIQKKKTTTMIQTLYFLIFYSFREGLASENGDTYSNSTRLSRDSVVNDHLPRCHVQDDFSYSTFPKPKQEFKSLIWCPLKHVSPRTYVMVSTKTCLHKV